MAPANVCDSSILLDGGFCGEGTQGRLCIGLVLPLGEPYRGTAWSREYKLPLIISALALVLPVAVLAVPVSPVFGCGHVFATAVLCAASAPKDEYPFDFKYE